MYKNDWMIVRLDNIPNFRDVPFLILTQTILYYLYRLTIIYHNNLFFIHSSQVNNQTFK